MHSHLVEGERPRGRHQLFIDLSQNVSMPDIWGRWAYLLRDRLRNVFDRHRDVSTPC